MGIAQKMLDNVLKKEFSVPSLTAHLVRRLLKKKGFELSEGELKKVVKQFLKALAQSRSFDLALPGVAGTVRIEEEDWQSALRELEKKLKTDIPQSLGEVSAEMVPKIVMDSIRENGAETLKVHRKQFSRFEKSLRRHWKDPLDQLEIMVAVAREAGQTTHEDWKNAFRRLRKAERAEKMDFATVLTSLHVKVCRTAGEVLCLLKSGYADGANARWRSLYELAVVLMFLVKHQGDLAERYLCHGHVERLRTAQQYQKYCLALSEKPYSQEEMDEMAALSERQLQRYGNDFRHDYGWAAHLFGRPKVGFSDLEGSIGFEHWKPYYKMSCHSVHAGAQGLFWSLGASERGVLLAGASDLGLADPGSNTAITLAQASAALFSYEANTDSIVSGKVLLMMSDEISQSFLGIHRGLKARTRTVRDYLPVLGR